MADRQSSREREARVRRERINAVVDKYDVSITVAEHWVKDWYRGRRNKGRNMANAAIEEAGLLYQINRGGKNKYSTKTPLMPEGMS